MTLNNSFQMYINGDWVSAESDELFEVYNPASGETYASVANADRNDTKRAIDAAVSAQLAWSNLPYTQRAGYFLKAADIIQRRNVDFVNALVDEGGSWIGKAMFESGYVPGIFRAAAAAAVCQMTGEIVPSEHGKVSMIVRQPLGVVSVISPWNAPFLLSSRGIAFALAVGNTVVLKPSEETPVSGGLLIAEVLEEAGLPNGVFNLITCARDNVAAVGDEMVANPNVKAISFTGSTAVGKQIAAQAGSLLKKVCLELGGKDALIILDDADMEKAVNAATFGCFNHQGQICMSTERIIVHKAIAEEFTDKFVSNVKNLKVGDPREMDNVIGPIINEKQLQKIHEQVTDALDKGASLHTGGKHDGLFYHPTVLTAIRPDMKIYREETFGPVAPVITVADVDEAVAVANDTEYGLSAGIITHDEAKGMAIAQRLETGMAHINDCSLNDEPNVPFGGVKNSGLGRHGGKASIESFTETRWITLERGGRHYPPPFLMKKY